MTEQRGSSNTETLAQQAEPSSRRLDIEKGTVHTPASLRGRGAALDGMSGL